MTGKLTGVAGINTNPLTNDFCLAMQETETICKNCYSCSMLKGIRKNCGPAWTRNGDLLKSKRLTVAELPTIPPTMPARFHAHGELFNKIHLINFYSIALFNPLSNFSLFTKRIELIRELKPERIPDNVTLVYSNPKVDKVIETPPAPFHKVFNVITDPTHPRINCGAKNCLKCLQCFKRTGESCIIELLK